MDEFAGVSDSCVSFVAEVIERVATEIFKRLDGKNHRGKKDKAVSVLDYLNREWMYQTSFEELRGFKNPRVD